MKSYTLAEHRKEKLRKRQAEIARGLRTSQGQVSKVESGHLPWPWERPRWAGEYGISVARFEALVRAAAARRELKRNLTDDYPLLATARGDGSRSDLPSVAGKAVSA